MQGQEKGQRVIPTSNQWCDLN